MPHHSIFQCELHGAREKRIKLREAADRLGLTQIELTKLAKRSHGPGGLKLCETEYNRFLNLDQPLLEAHRVVKPWHGRTCESSTPFDMYIFNACATHYLGLAVATSQLELFFYKYFDREREIVLGPARLARYQPELRCSRSEIDYWWQSADAEKFLRFAIDAYVFKSDGITDALKKIFLQELNYRGGLR